jgi:DNA-directed RNA polymerase subunit M/transcription elongation factor TFIIS
MNLKELYEGATPKLAGAAKGIQIMTPQQFIAKSAAGEEPGSEVDEGIAGAIAGGALGAYAGKSPTAAMTGASMGSEVQDLLSSSGVMGVTPQSLGLAEMDNRTPSGDRREQRNNSPKAKAQREKEQQERLKKVSPEMRKKLGLPEPKQGVAEGFPHDVDHMPGKTVKHQDTNCTTCHGRKSMYKLGGKLFSDNKPGAAKVKCPSCRGTGEKQGVAEATALPASTRELKGQELTDYLDRIRNQEKQKTDKYKLPYIHRSSVIGYYNAEGKKYDTDAIKKGLAQRPEKLLKKNEKMRHSDGAQEQFFNIGFAALVGVALDENTNEIIIVNTCPGAGSCKVDCFAMKGGKVQFAGPWLSDGRILTYLLNHPNEFFEQLKSEISKEAAKGKKGGYSVSIRWHDAGDFFSPEYMDMAFKLAQSLPDVKFYAYTKVASAAMANKPANFIINWSEGASTSQEKQIKRNDPNLDITKNSRIVPSSLFYDLLVKDAKKNLVKGPEGQWQVIPDELPELKQRLADKYGISKNSILSYDEWNTKGKNNKSMKWNVIVAPGEPDLTANDPGVLGTLLLKH